MWCRVGFTAAVSEGETQTAQQETTTTGKKEAAPHLALEFSLWNMPKKGA